MAKSIPKKKSSMSASPYTQWGDPVLSTPTRFLSLREIKSAKMQRIFNKMLKTLDAAEAFGIAANQVGLPLRFAVMRIKADPERPKIEPLPLMVVINPVIVARSKEKQFGADLGGGFRFWEACLSAYNPEGPMRFLTERSYWVDVKYLDQTGKVVKRRVRGLQAVLFLHETDHLDGRVCAESVVVRNGKVVPGVYATNAWYRKNKGALPPGLKSKKKSKGAN